MKAGSLRALPVGMEGEAATVETAVLPGYMGSHRTQHQIPVQQQFLTQGHDPFGSLNDPFRGVAYQIFTLQVITVSKLQLRSSNKITL